MNYRVQFISVFALVFSVLAYFFSYYWLLGFSALIFLMFRPLVIDILFRWWMAFGGLLAIVFGSLVIRMLYYILLAPAYALKVLNFLEFGADVGFCEPTKKSSCVHLNNFDFYRDY